MKMHALFFLSLIMIVFLGCNKDDAISQNSDYSGFKPIQIGGYELLFPPDFELVALQGYDSYVGNVEGSTLTFQFDSGYYTRPFENVDLDKYDLQEDVIDEISRQILRSKSPDYTTAALYIYDLNKYLDDLNGQIPLSLRAMGELTEQQQELAIKILSSAKPIN